MAVSELDVCVVAEVVSVSVPALVPVVEEVADVVGSDVEDDWMVYDK